MYPTFHLIREEEVSKAVDSIGGDSGKVWKRNVRFLRNLEEKCGRAAVEDAMSGHVDDDVRAVLRGENLLKGTQDEDTDFYERFTNK